MSITRDILNGKFQMLSEEKSKFSEEKILEENVNKKPIKVTIKWEDDLGKKGEHDYEIHSNNDEHAVNKAYDLHNKWAKQNKKYIVRKMAHINEEKSQKYSNLKETVLNEISKKKLGKYIDKASQDLYKKGTKLAYTDLGSDERKNNVKRSSNRMKGIMKATNRLVKEDVKQLDESLFNMSKYRNYYYDKSKVLHGVADKLKKRIDEFLSFADRFNWEQMSMKEKSQLKNRLSELENTVDEFYGHLDKMQAALEEAHPAATGSASLAMAAFKK